MVSEATEIVQRGFERALRGLWPKRSQTELLLDLGERKPWNHADEAAAVLDLSEWLATQLELRVASSAEAPPAADELSVLHQLGQGLAREVDAAGVAAWIVGLAPAVGASAKTLANSLAGGLRSDRRDHRWLRLLMRVVQGSTALDAWLYHRRDADSVASEISRWSSATQFDTGDAMLCSSLIALWQRRRPTEQVRANRGRTRERRQTAMPIAGLAGELVELGQVVALTQVCAALEPGQGRALALVTAEAALTEAHLKPHPVRGRAETGSGELWLQAVERLIVNSEVLSTTDAGLLRFRIERMRAWRERRPQQPVDAALRDEPYVRASLYLEALLCQVVADPEQRFESATPGLLMLVPQLRARGAIES